MEIQVGDIIVTHSDEVVVVIEVHNLVPMNAIYSALAPGGEKVIIHDFQIKNVIKKGKK